MEAAVASTNAESGDEERIPLISSNHPTPSPPPAIEDEIRPWQPSETQPAIASVVSPPSEMPPAKSPRLVSLDVFRGLTVAVRSLLASKILQKNDVSD
jgi:hypothetical protein